MQAERREKADLARATFGIFVSACNRHATSPISLRRGAEGEGLEGRGGGGIPEKGMGRDEGAGSGINDVSVLSQAASRASVVAASRSRNDRAAAGKVHSCVKL
jgi:hypothetical protein